MMRGAPDFPVASKIWLISSTFVFCIPRILRPKVRRNQAVSPKGRGNPSVIFLGQSFAFRRFTFTYNHFELCPPAPSTINNTPNKNGTKKPKIEACTLLNSINRPGAHYGDENTDPQWDHGKATRPCLDLFKFRRIGPFFAEIGFRFDDFDLRFRRVWIRLDRAHQIRRLLSRDLAILHHLQYFLAFFRRHYLPPSKALSNCFACSAVIFFSANIFNTAM